MDAIIEQHYQDRIREFFVKESKPVHVDQKQRELYPEDPSRWVSLYGWTDFEALNHFMGYGKSIPCPLVIPKGVKIVEIAYMEFQDTFTGTTVEAGLNAYGGDEGDSTEIHCECGMHRGITLRWGERFEKFSITSSIARI
jgi:hypothetical protein